MHLDDEQIERLRDGEAVPEAARQHVARCGVCTSRIALTRAEVDDLTVWLAALDPSHAAISSETTANALRATLAKVAEPTPEPAAGGPARPRPRLRRHVAAAA